MFCHMFATSHIRKKDRRLEIWQVFRSLAFSFKLNYNYYALTMGFDKSDRNGFVSSSKISDRSFSSTWNKAITRNSKWPDKDEFLDVIYWSRQVIGIVLGLIWGIIPLLGFVGLFLFCILNAVIIYIYSSNFQEIDEEEFGGLWEITKEGFVTSFAGFLVMWIIAYSGLHFD